MKQQSGKAVSEYKRRKTDHLPFHGSFSSPGTRVGNALSAGNPTASKPQSSTMNYNIEQAKHFAVAQAQHDGSTGNFRIFDSPFGNYLVPVVPNRAEFAG